MDDAKQMADGSIRGAARVVPLAAADIMVERVMWPNMMRTMDCALIQQCGQSKISYFLRF